MLEDDCNELNYIITDTNYTDRECIGTLMLILKCCMVKKLEIRLDNELYDRFG